MRNASDYTSTMHEPEYVEKLKSSAIQMGIAAICMQDFAARVMWHVRNGGTLDDASLTAIKAKCLVNLKSMEGRGLSIDEEAAALNKALVHFETLMVGAIQKSKNLED